MKTFHTIKRPKAPLPVPFCSPPDSAARRDGRSREQGNCPPSALVPCSCPPHAGPWAPTLALAQGRVVTTEGGPARGSPTSPAPSPLPRPAGWPVGSRQPKHRLRQGLLSWDIHSYPILCPACYYGGIMDESVTLSRLASTVITNISIYIAPQNLKMFSHLICTAIP